MPLNHNGCMPTHRVYLTKLIKIYKHATSIIRAEVTLRLRLTKDLDVITLVALTVLHSQYCIFYTYVRI